MMQPKVLYKGLILLCALLVYNSEQRMGREGWCVCSLSQKQNGVFTGEKKSNCLLLGTNPEPHRREVREGTKVGYLFAKYLSTVFLRKEKKMAFYICSKKKPSELQKNIQLFSV
jgi:hypothetical protein